MGQNAPSGRASIPSPYDRAGACGPVTAGATLDRVRAPLPLWAELVVGSILILAIGYVAALLTSSGQILLAGGVTATALGLLASLFEPADSGGRISRPVGLALGVLGLVLVAVEAWSSDAEPAQILWGSVAEWATAYSSSSTTS